MDKNLHSLSKIFTEKLYRIPDYQRGYAWTDKQLKDFLGDLKQLEKGKNHYLGVLTLEEVANDIVREWKDDYWIVESKSYEPYYIVDGQQRLTTAIILIKAILESTEKTVKLNYNTISEIQKKFIFDSKDEGISRSYIFGYEKDNPSYEFLKTKIFGEISESSSDIQETIYTHNLENAKAFFVKEINKLTIEEKEELYRKLTQNLLFNIYTISSDIDVFVAFETMNNRGKPLSYLELLKNRLIYLSTRFNEPQSEKERLRYSINECWKSIYYNLGRNKNNPLDDDSFLYNHFITYFANDFDDEDEKVSTSKKKFVIRRYLRDNYEKYLLEHKFTTKSFSIKNDFFNNNEGVVKTPLTVSDIYRYVKSLKISVELWYHIANPQDSRFSEEEKLWLDKLNRIQNNSKHYKLNYFSASPLIMIFFQKESNSSKRIKFLKVLEGLMFLILLHGYNYYLYLEIERTDFIDKAVNLSQDLITTEKLIRELEEQRSHIANEKELLKRIKGEFKSENFYKWRGIRYFLYEYDLFLQSKSKTKRVKINWEEFSKSSEYYDYKTVEHIYPQNPRKSCWTNLFKHYSQKERNILRHSLGNLLPLSQPKNSSFSNKCFSEKISGDANSMIGYRYGSYSENEITDYKDWTAKEILERGIKLLDFMEKRWNLTIGDKKGKIDFLNLNFVLLKEKDST